MRQATEELRVYFARIRPLCRELFGMAHAICGNYELAEYAMQRAILEGFHRTGRSKSRIGIRENMRGLVRRIAYEQTLLIDDAELTWDGFQADKIDGAGEDQVLRLAASEEVDVRRMLVLRYGCQMRVREIAHLVGASPKQVSSALDRFERRLGRRLAARQHMRVEAMISRSAREALSREPNAPDAGAVFRSFEAEASQPEGRPRVALRALNGVLAIVLALVCVVIFWVVAVLIQSPESRLEEAPTATAAVGEFSPAQTVSPTEEPFLAIDL